MNDWETDWKWEDPETICDPDGKPVSIKSILDQANSVSILTVVSDLGIRIDPARKIRCPFHKNGNEISPGMVLYTDSNRFYCFVCARTGRPVEFFSAVRKVKKLEAALMILKNHAGATSEYSGPDARSGPINDKIILDFATQIRQFIRTNHYSQDSICFAEKLTYVLDRLNERHNMPSQALISTIDKLRTKLSLYT